VANAGRGMPNKPVLAWARPLAHSLAFVRASYACDDDFGADETSVDDGRASERSACTRFFKLAATIAAVRSFSSRRRRRRGRRCPCSLARCPSPAGKKMHTHARSLALALAGIRAQVRSNEATECFVRRRRRASSFPLCWPATLPTRERCVGSARLTWCTQRPISTKKSGVLLLEPPPHSRRARLHRSRGGKEAAEASLQGILRRRGGKVAKGAKQPDDANQYGFVGALEAHGIQSNSP